MLGMLGGEDVVERRQLIEVGIAGFRVAAMQVLGKFQHVVGVARLRAVDVLYEVLAGLPAGEVLAAAVTAEGQRALARHDVPEEGTSGVVGLVARQFGDALETDDLGHLCVGVHVVQTVAACHQRTEQPAVREAAGHVEIFLLTGHGVGIGQHLVHAAVLRVEHTLHLGIGETVGEFDSPVAEA